MDIISVAIILFIVYLVLSNIRVSIKKGDKEFTWPPKKSKDIKGTMTIEKKGKAIHVIDFDASKFYTKDGKFRIPRININSPIKISDMTDYTEIREDLKDRGDKIKDICDFNRHIYYLDLEFEVECISDCFDKIKKFFNDDLKIFKKMNSYMFEELNTYCFDVCCDEIIFYENLDANWFNALKGTDFIDEIEYPLEEYLRFKSMKELREICKENGLKTSRTKEGLINIILENKIPIKKPKKFKINKKICEKVKEVHFYYLKLLEDEIKLLHPYYQYAILDSVEGNCDNFGIIEQELKEKVRHLEYICEKISFAECS